MALIYGLVRAIAFALLKMATWKHNRAKARLEKADKAFRDIENSCKADEVASGRPASFTSQFKMMKLFEVRDAADSKWKSAIAKMQKRQRNSQWLKNFSGRKIPYIVGLIDMAGLFGIHQWFIDHPDQWGRVAELVKQVL